MLKKMTIKMRLLWGFTIGLGMMLLVGLMTLGASWNITDKFTDYIQNGEAALSAAKECRVYTLWIATDVRNMVIDRTPDSQTELKKRIAAEKQAFTTKIGELKTAYTANASGHENIANNSTAIDEYETAVLSWMKTADEIVALADAGNYSTAEKMIVDECTPALNKTVDLASKIQADLDTVSKEEISKTRLYANYASFFMIGLMVLAGIFIILMAFRIIKSIIRPIAEVQEAAEAMAKGVLTHPISYESKDAVGQLADSLRTSMAVLSSYVYDIDKAMASMAEGNFDVQPSQHFIGDFKSIEVSIDKFLVKMCRALHAIKDAVNTMDSATQNVSQGATVLGNGASAQASSIEELSAAITEVSEKINRGADQAQKAQETVMNVGGELETSTRQMDEMVAAMQNISRSSDEIGKIIKTIEDIAFQTNILALNAAVEAARAGAAGKGFAVVADEVRNLASKSAEAAKGTTTMIGDSQSAIVSGGKIVERTSGSLYKVEAGAKSVTEMILEISEAAALQAQAIVLVTQEIGVISDVVQTNAATAEESAAAAEEIASQAESLAEMVNHFVLKDEEILKHLEQAAIDLESGKMLA